jgi:hypothetical protein
VGQINAQNGSLLRLCRHLWKGTVGNDDDTHNDTTGTVNCHDHGNAFVDDDQIIFSIIKRSLYLIIHYKLKLPC